jgi:drug/metabolite transporter (DMT)-like permease
MGHLFLGEPFTPRELLSALTSLIGVVFITKPHALFGGRDEDLLISESGETLGAGWGIGEGKFAVGLGLLGVISASAACE